MTDLWKQYAAIEQRDRDAAAWNCTIPGPDGDRLREHFARAFAIHRTAAINGGE